MRPPAPTRRRRLLLGVASCAVLAGLVGCAATGSGQDDGAATPATTGSADGSAGGSVGATPTPGQDPSSQETGTPGSSEASGRPRLVELVSMTAAGGTVTTEPTPVAGEAARSRYLAAFDARARDRLRTAFAQVDAPRAGELSATVVAVGCVPPEDVQIVATGADTGTGYEVVAVATKSPDVQCFAPVTTVALVLLPA